MSMEQFNNRAATLIAIFGAELGLAGYFIAQAVESGSNKTLAPKISEREVICPPGKEGAITKTIGMLAGRYVGLSCVDGKGENASRPLQLLPAGGGYTGNQYNTVTSTHVYFKYIPDPQENPFFMQAYGLGYGHSEVVRMGGVQALKDVTFSTPSDPVRINTQIKGTPLGS
jgi:hypothetical protein